MARAIKPVSVAGIEFDALIDESRQLDAQIPQYSTEEGFQISDAIIVEAETLSMTLFVTDTPVTWRGRHPGIHAGDVCARLESLYFNKEPVTVETSDATYTMMGIQSITFQKSLEVGYSKEIPITFRKIRKTYTRTIEGLGDLYGSGGTTGQYTGLGSTEEKNTGTPGSIAYIAGDALTGGALSGSGESSTATTGRVASGGRRRTTSTVQGTINNNNTGGGYSPGKELSRANQVFQ